jgi:DnaJ-like protein
MKSAGRVSAALIGCTLVFAVTAAALGAAQQAGTSEETAATPIEQALIEHVCSVVPPSGGPESDRYLVCLRSQLSSLRADFGRDLGRLSAADRKTLDSVCNRVRNAQGRDAYLDCLGAQLLSIRNKRSRGTSPPAPEAAPLPTPAEIEAPGGAPPAQQQSAGSASVWIGAIVLIVLAAGGGALFFLKTRRASHKCRVCASDVPAAGDLCQKCRHEAAEAVRRAAAERAEQARAQEAEQKRQKEQEEEQRREKAQQEDEDRLLLEHQQRQEEARKRAEEERRQEEEAREQRQSAVVPQEEFDPYAVLEVARNASKDDIRAAYEEAKVKCDPAQVSHLGDEVQEHFRLKSQAVERAYQILTE